MKKRQHIVHMTPRTRILHNTVMPLVIGLSCFLACSLLAKTSLLQRLEMMSYDWRMRTMPRTAVHYPDPRIVIIALDEESFSKIDIPYLLWLPRYTRILRALKAGGAKVIALDVMFQRTPDDFIQEGILEVLGRMELGQSQKRAFAAAAQDYSPRFDNELGMEVKSTGTILACWIEEESDRYALPHKEITLFAGEENLASVTIHQDGDGVVRRMASQWTDRDGRTFPTLSFLAAARFLGREKDLYDGSLLKTVAFHSGLDMMVSYTGPPGTFRQISFARVDSESAQGNERFFRDNFKGSIVLIGHTDMASLDLKRTPFSDFFPGVEMYASALNTILHGDYIRTLPAGFGYGVRFLMALGYFFIGFRLPLLRSIMFTALLSAAYTGAALHAFWAKGLWVDLASPLTTLVVVLFASYAYRHVVIERERNWIRGVLGRYVSTNVAEAILARPESIGLGGEGREITVVFSDINHFTTLAESNAPEIIMEALNDYFTLMEEIIFRHRGTLKQFVGDEIMVIFGAPEHQEDHRKRAVLAALEMKEALERWSEERKGRGDLYFSAKLGVHSGPVIVGNVGSVHRTEYAAVGDTVNTGARIMGLNKSLGTTLLISDAVYEEVSEIVEVEDKGFHSVKGKGGQLHIYSMTGRKGEVGVAVKANFG